MVYQLGISNILQTLWATKLYVIDSDKGFKEIKEKEKIYSTEFKESSIKLAIESAQPIAHTARELGINPNTFYTWVNKYSTAPNTNGSKVHSDNRAYDEIMKLKKELARVTQECAILKKATAYFAKESW